jgi:hypothetical protein
VLLYWVAEGAYRVYVQKSLLTKERKQRNLTTTNMLLAFVMSLCMIMTFTTRVLQAASSIPTSHISLWRRTIHLKLFPIKHRAITSYSWSAIFCHDSPL